MGALRKALTRICVACGSAAVLLMAGSVSAGAVGSQSAHVAAESRLAPARISDDIIRDFQTLNPGITMAQIRRAVTTQGRRAMANEKLAQLAIFAGTWFDIKRGVFHVYLTHELLANELARSLGKAFPLPVKVHQVQRPESELEAIFQRAGRILDKDKLPFSLNIDAVQNAVVVYLTDADTSIARRLRKIDGVIVIQNGWQPVGVGAS